MFQFFKGAHNKLSFLTCSLLNCHEAIRARRIRFSAGREPVRGLPLPDATDDNKRFFFFPPDISGGDDFTVIVFSYLRAILDILEKQESWVIQELR